MESNLNIPKKDSKVELTCDNNRINISVKNPELTLQTSSPTLDLIGVGGDVIHENDHNKLLNRDAQDQHPISAITGLQEALDNIPAPTNCITREEFEAVKDEVGLALKDKANKKDIPTDYISDDEFTFVQQEMVRLLDEKADKTQIPTIPTNISAFNNDVGYLTEHQDISHLVTQEQLEDKVDQKEFDDVVEDVGYLLNLKQDKLTAGENITIVDNVISATGGGEINTDNFVSQSEFQGVVNQFGNIVDNLQPKGDYTTRAELANVSINVSEDDNLYKDNNILKAFTEAGNKAITEKFTRSLNLPMQGEWKSLVTDTGYLLLYSGSVLLRTKNGKDFEVIYLPSSPSNMGKCYEQQLLVASTPLSAGMWMYSYDDGLTWTYTSNSVLSGFKWDNVCVKNTGSAKTGWHSGFCLTRTGSTTKNFANYSTSGNRFEINANSKNTTQFVTALGYDYWCANSQGEVFKTSGSSGYTIYETTKAGLTCIKTCNDNIFCGFSDGTIAELVGYKQPWNFYTVAEGEKVTDIKYQDGVYYVVTEGANFYTSTDLNNWTKYDNVASYGGSLEFTRFGIVLANSKPAVVPSQQRIEDSLLELYDKTNPILICGPGIMFENGMYKLDVMADNPVKLYSNGKLGISNIEKSYFSQEIIKALIASQFYIDYCPADDYDSWLWGDSENGYWNTEFWANKSVLWICTADGYLYDPLAWNWEFEVAQFDVIRLVYSEWGDSCEAEIIGNLAQLKELFKE